jgi:hypothetical protein
MIFCSIVIWVVEVGKSLWKVVKLQCDTQKIEFTGQELMKFLRVFVQSSINS